MTPRSTTAFAEPAAVARRTASPADTLWREDQFLAPVADWLPTVKLLSLDIFDTLLLRACRRPEDVFLEIGRRAEAAGLLRPGLAAGEFAAIREKAQHTCYSTLGREPRLEDIYERMQAAIGAPRALIAALVAIEEQAEADACFLNPSVLALVRHCNDLKIPVVLLSDMYLGEARVRALLERVGFDIAAHVTRVIVSVDAGCYKMTGASYAHLLELYPSLAAGSILHIGDNLRSDVLAARAAGLRAVHYNVVRHDPDATLTLEELAAGDLLPELTPLRRLGSSLGERVPAGDRAWFRTGADVIGPFVSALVDWTLDQCVKSGITLVAPLMREGHLLAPFLTRAAQARGIEIDVQPLYVSRHSVALAGLTDVATEFIPRIVDTRRQFTIGDLFALIGIAVPQDIEPYRTTLTTSATAVQLPSGQALRDCLVGHLQSDAVQADLRKLVRTERRRLVDYLDGVFGHHRTVATLDIGFFGQIQRSLSTALSGEAHPATITHLLGFGHGPVLDDVLRGSDVRTFAGGYGSDSELVRTIHRSAPVIEQLLQGPEGTTTGYLSSNGRAVPIRERNPLAARELALKALVQEGATAFHTLWLAFRQVKPQLSSDLIGRRSSWCRLIHRLIATPSQGEAARLGSLHDDVNFGSSAVLPFCPPDLETQVMVSGAEAAERRGPAAMPAVWPHGVISRAEPGALVRRHADAVTRPYVAIAHAVARHLVRSRLTRVVGYGTGDVATAFIEASTILGIEVVALVDSDTRRHGIDVAGVPVISLDTAVGLPVHAYVVLSIAHAAPISDAIRRRSEAEPHVPLVFDLTHSSLTKVKHP